MLEHLIDTVRVLVGREMRIRYKGSFFGILWAILSPLGMVVVLQFVFTQVIAYSMPNYAAFIYCGLLPWVWFQSAVQTATTTLNDNRDLVRTPFFPKPMLPCAVTLTNFILYLMALPVLVALLVVDGIPPKLSLLALPAIWLAHGLLTLGFTVAISAAAVVVRDVQHLMGIVFLFWFYLTPIFYDLRQVPSRMAWWFALNPLTPIVAAHRAVSLEGRMPDWPSLAYSAIVGVVVLGVGLVTFRTLEDAFIEQV